ncbi:MAG TPA: hypothetical protein VF741_00075, partial [Candidatus Aquilonibacter sp.]
ATPMRLLSASIRRQIKDLSFPHDPEAEFPAQRDLIGHLPCLAVDTSHYDLSSQNAATLHR